MPERWPTQLRRRGLAPAEPRTFETLVTTLIARCSVDRARAAHGVREFLNCRMDSGLMVTEDRPE